MSLDPEAPPDRIINEPHLGLTKGGLAFKVDRLTPLHTYYYLTLISPIQLKSSRTCGLVPMKTLHMVTEVNLMCK